MSENDSAGMTRRSAGPLNIGEVQKYYVLVAVDRCLILGVIIRAENEDAAVQRAEMKVAIRMRDAITVQAINVREG
jgi:hypothetical protein